VTQAFSTSPQQAAAGPGPTQNLIQTGATGPGGRARFGAPVIEIGKLFDRTPPHSIESEQALLGAMLLDPACIADILQLVKGPEAFYLEAHAAIFSALVTLADKHNTADALLLGERLADQGRLDSVGGKDYIIRLAEAVPTAVNAKWYAQRVSEKAKLRKLIAAAGETLHEVYTMGQHAEDESARELIDKAESRVFAIAQAEQGSDAQDMKTLIMEEYKRVEEAAAGNAPTGVLTGFHELDKMLGGLQPGELVILAARPSMGKTAFALNLAEQIAFGSDTPRSIHPAAGRQPAPVGFFSLEMSKGSLCQRLLSAWSGIDSKRLRLGQLHKAEYRTLLDCAQDLAVAPIFIDDQPGLSITALRARARRMASQHQIKAIFLDYLQLLSSPAQARESRQVEVSAISRGVKELARELKVPIVALSQLNRGAENREGNRPRLSDLRESGSLEQDADVVLLLHREEYYHLNDAEWEANNPDKKGMAEIIVAKQRNGPTGSVSLTFVPSETRFKNFAGPGMAAPDAAPRPKYDFDAQTVREVGRVQPRPEPDVASAFPASAFPASAFPAPTPRPSGFSSTVRPAGPISNHRDGGGPDRTSDRPVQHGAPTPINPEELDEEPPF
jgi:replicative DNA helicase